MRAPACISFVSPCAPPLAVGASTCPKHALHRWLLNAWPVAACAMREAALTALGFNMLPWLALEAIQPQWMVCHMRGCHACAAALSVTTRSVMTLHDLHLV